MAVIKPFKSIRPREEVAARVAALPYDVYNRREALAEVRKEPLSFLAIDRAETQFDDSVGTYDERVYEKARELLRMREQDGTFLKEETPCYYIYELVMDGRVQTGIVACASIDDYENDIIRKHEKTREDKEMDRIHHVDRCNAQTGPIFLAYRQQKALSDLVMKTKIETPIYQFMAEDGVRHTVWRISETETLQRIEKAFAKVDHIYIADGHHRAASAVKVGLKRRRENPGYDGREEFNYFLSVLFPDSELTILPYNRAVKDLNGYTKEQFLERVAEHFYIKERGKEAIAPASKKTFGLYLESSWYELILKEDALCSNDPVDCLDVAVLQNYLLQPVLGIKDPRVDKRIEFIGGIRGLRELEKRVASDMAVAFSMYPTTIQELFAVSDEGKLMPPKSTWFEPKLRSGLFIHEI